MNMRRALKWTAIVVGGVAVVGFLVFLYVMPPFFLIAPEQFGKDMRDGAPPVANVADETTRAMAERGRYIVMSTGCIGCHMPLRRIFRESNVPTYLPDHWIKVYRDKMTTTKSVTQ